MLYHKVLQHESSDEWVIFVHGAGGSSATFYRQIKDFKKHFNIVMLDLRGHGRSKDVNHKRPLKHYSFDKVSEDVIEVMDHLKIKEAHFVGVSLGTIINRILAEKYPERVKSLVMGGAITKMNIRSNSLINIGNLLKHIVPFSWIYKILAFVIMPSRYHKESRNLFIREAKKIYQKEFLRWFKLTKDINPLLRKFKGKPLKKPALYIMGDEDHLFLETLKRDIGDHQTSQLIVLDNCGHVCNIDQANEFNKHSISFLKACS